MYECMCNRICLSVCTSFLQHGVNYGETSLERYDIVSLHDIFWFYLSLACRLQGLGFERGWGDTAERVLEMMHLLLDILNAPDPSTLEKFLGRIPMVFDVVILSPHGYFGQANVLGLPDTGGQVFIIFSFFFLLHRWQILFFILLSTLMADTYHTTVLL